MDNTLQSMAAFASGMEFASIPPAAVELTRRHLIDALACGAGGFSSEPARKIRRAIGPGHGTGDGWGASAYGIATPTTPEFAAFANASMNRYLDFNDFGPAGHPSDMMPSLLAVAESVGANGAAVVRGIYVAYEVATALADAVPFTEIPFDVGMYYSAGAAAGMASIMSLASDASANAISLSVVPSLPLPITRRSPISEWRSSATAHACMAAAFASRLARAGLTGPSEPFDGPGGLFEFLGRRPAIVLGADACSPSAIERGSLKRYQACFLAQSSVDAARRIRAHPLVRAAIEDLDGGEPRGRPEDGPAAVAPFRRISVSTTRDTWWYIGGGAGDEGEKWSPSTRETADHSLPYIVSNVLLNGEIDFDTYSPDALKDRTWDPLIRRVEVLSDDELTGGPQSGLNPARVTVELLGGDLVSELSTFPYDQIGRPMVSGTDVKEKFFELVRRVLPVGESEELFGLLDDLHALSDLERLGSLLRAFSDSAR